MPRRWVRERRKDEYYLKAKKEGYRSRASYKLLQIQERFSIIAEGARVVDLGAAPGGWSQVAAELAGLEGTVVGVDLAPIEPLEGVVFLRGDMTEPETVARAREAIGGEADVVVSDMSPNISGIYTVDHSRSVHLVENALAFAQQVLRPGGHFVAKLFDGDLSQNLVARVERSFDYVRVHNPDASRSASSEVYVVAKRFKRGARAGPPREAKAEWREGEPLGDYRF